MSEDEKGYNGWKNYETWSVALIVDNDQDSYNERREIVRAAMAQAGTDGSARRGFVSDALKDWLEKTRDHVGTELQEWPMGYLWDQLLSAALSEVDWYELADAWMEEEEDASAEA